MIIDYHNLGPVTIDITGPDTVIVDIILPLDIIDLTIYLVNSSGTMIQLEYVSPGNYRWIPTRSLLSTDSYWFEGIEVMSGSVYYKSTAFEITAIKPPSISEYATLESPEFTGTPTAPTASPGTDTQQIATTAFVHDAVPVQDVQINETSILNNGVANVPIADNLSLGVVRGYMDRGVVVLSDGRLTIRGATNAVIKAGANGYLPITALIQNESVFYGLAKAAGSDEKNSTLPIGSYTEAAKSAIQTMLNGPVTITGATPSITALPGIQYICGEVATLDITLPASGCIDVVFQSGSTATVLTVTPPTGVTVKWANGFDPTSLDANTTYEINIMDGLGVGAAWT